MPSKSKINIHDVAKASGFSVYTVSSVLNNKGDISPKTSRIVRQVAQELNYSILGNVSAVEKINMRTIGIVLPEPGCLQNSFYNRAISSLITRVCAKGYNCRLFTEDDIQKLVDPNQSEGLHALGCGGLVIFCPRQDYSTYIRNLLKRSVAVALVRRRSTEQPGLCQIVDNDTQNMTTLLTYILDNRGSHRMIMVGDPHKTSSQVTSRSKTFMDFASKKLSTGNYLLTSQEQWEDPDKVQEFKRFILDGEKCTLCCWTDAVAMRVLMRLNQFGIHIPKDAYLTGYNDDPDAEIAIPSITSMRIPVEEMIESACEYLFENLDSENLPPAVTREFTHSLIERTSTQETEI